MSHRLRRASLACLCVLTFTACDKNESTTPAAPTAPAVSSAAVEPSVRATMEVFNPPPLPTTVPVAPPPVDTTGFPTGVGFGEATFAQTCTATADGTITEVQLGLIAFVHDSGRTENDRNKAVAPPDVLIEIRPVDASGSPQAKAGAAMGRVRVSADTLKRDENHLLRFNFQDAGIAVKKGDRLAVVVRPSPGLQLQSQTVSNGTASEESSADAKQKNYYSGGALYTMRNGVWNVFPSAELQLRVLADSTAKKTDQPASRPSPATMPELSSPIDPNDDVGGDAIVEILPLPVNNRPALRAPREIPVAGAWQIRVVPFKAEDGKWWAQIGIFNGTSGGSYSGGYGGQQSLQVVLLREDSGETSVVFPSTVRNSADPDSYSGYNQGGVPRGQGVVRIVKLWNTPEAMPPGKYRITAIWTTYASQNPTAISAQSTFEVR